MRSRGRYRWSPAGANGYPSPAVASADLQRKQIYLQPEQFESPPVPFRTGEAGEVWVGEAGEIHSDRQLRISANSTHALLGHGVVDALNRLPLEGELGRGRDVMIPHAVLEDAQLVFYEADRKTYGGSWEFAVPSGDGTESVDYRVRVHNREYQRTLSRLTFLLGSAGRAGRAVRLRIQAPR